MQFLLMHVVYHCLIFKRCPFGIHSSLTLQNCKSTKTKNIFQDFSFHYMCHHFGYFKMTLNVFWTCIPNAQQQSFIRANHSVPFHQVSNMHSEPFSKICCYYPNSNCPPLLCSSGKTNVTQLTYKVLCGGRRLI